LAAWLNSWRRKPGYLAVGIDPGSIRFAHIARSRQGRPRASLWKSVARSSDAGDDDSMALGRIAGENSFERYACTTVFAPSDYQILVVDAPNVPRDELKAAIRWRIKDMIDYHVDDATIDVMEIPASDEEGAKPRSMFAVTASNQAVQKRIGVFERAGVELKVIDIPDTAQRNIAVLYEQPERATAMLSFSESGGMLTVSARQELILSRRLDVSWQQLAAEAQRPYSFERVSAALRRSLDIFERQYQLTPVAELLLAPLPEPVGLQEHLAESLYVPVRSITLDEVIDFPADRLPSSAEQWAFFHLFGAALRNEVKAP
jgi:MSHA biogenesis protein MshI